MIEEYENSNSYQKLLIDSQRREMVNKVSIAAYHDSDSKLGTYYLVNPKLEAPRYEDIFELDRIVMTRYRTGSHNLRIETGRMSKPFEPRENRLCLCDTDVQTLKHCLLACPLLMELRDRYGINNIAEFMSDSGAAKYLHEMEKKLQL